MIKDKQEMVLRGQNVKRSRIFKKVLEVNNLKRYLGLGSRDDR
jgi:hypothetical protein